MQRLDRKGFTLIEVIVVAGIIAILAGILVPLIFKEIDEAKISRSSADIKSITTAMIVLKKDTAQWPVLDSSCSDSVTLLYGQGTLPANLSMMGFDSDESSAYDEHLSRNDNACYNNWKGPYIAIVSPDPWGNAYVTNASAFRRELRPVWVLSAGPNGRLETPAMNEILVGDDIGFRIK